MVRPAVVNLAKRVPLIHFRKGGAGSAAPAGNQQASSQPAGGKKVNFSAHLLRNTLFVGTVNIIL